MTSSPDTSNGNGAVPAALQFTSTPVEVEMEPFFSIDDVTYYIPKEVSGSLALQALELVSSRGELVAAAEIFKLVIGEDALKALLGCKGLKQQDVAAVMKIVSDKAMGALEGVAGK